jgi:hypothetical protein
VGADDVYGAVRPVRVDEAMGIAGAVGVEPGDLPRVVDTPRARAGGQRKVDGGVGAAGEQEAVLSCGIRPDPDDVASGVDPGGSGSAGGPRKLMSLKVPPLLKKPCSALAAST